MALSVSLLKSVAASGTASVTIPVTDDTVQFVEVRVACSYAAVAGTSGISAAVQVSPDGTAFSNSNVSGLTLNPAANVIGTGLIVVPVSNNLNTKVDGGPIESVKINLTNADATNGAVVTVIASQLSFKNNNV
jgi:hypothetical protein